MTKHGNPMRFFLEHVHDQTDNCVLWPFATSKKGYGQIHLPTGLTYVHVLSCQEHHGPCPPGKETLHSCRNRHCFNGRHLSWGTRRQNVADRHRDGTVPNFKGERGPSSKLMDTQRDEIVARYAAGGVTHRSLAAEYGVTKSTITHTLREWKA